MEFNQAIFRSYDIRGVYPTDFDENISSHIGKAIGTLLIRKGLKKVVVGRDNRKSSPVLSKTLIEGLLSTGCEVVDVGISITPVIHFLTCVKDFDCGIIVTASHNPKEYNGFRIDYRSAAPFYGDDIKDLMELIGKEDYEEGRGSTSEEDLFGLYLDYLKERFSFSKDIKVVLDCGNGTASFVAPIIFEALGCSVTLFYCDSDSEYPHGTPDPEDRLFMRALQKRVLENNGDVGFAFDTDVDRLGVVDEKGNVYETDKLLLLFAEDILSRIPGSTVIYDVKCSKVVDDQVKSFGGVPKMLKTGHTYFVEEIQKGAILGCEFSGHIFFGDDRFGYDDGIYAACRVLELMRNYKGSVSQIIGDPKIPLSILMEKYPRRFHSSEIKISCPDEIKFSLIDTLLDNIGKVQDVNEVINIDGARVHVTDTGWFLIRASNTTAVISIRVEGIDRTEVNLMLERVRNLLLPFDYLDLSELDSVEIFES